MWHILSTHYIKFKKFLPFKMTFIRLEEWHCAGPELASQYSKRNSDLKKKDLNDKVKNIFHFVQLTRETNISMGISVYNVSLNPLKALKILQHTVFSLPIHKHIPHTYDMLTHSQKFRLSMTFLHFNDSKVNKMTLQCYTVMRLKKMYQLIMPPNGQF